MTKPTTKAKAAAKQSAPAAPLIVLGYDENHKPQAARFPAAEAELVAKAAQLMDLKVYQAATEDLAALAKKLPVGRLYSNGRGFVPNVRQSLYSEIIVALAVEPQAAVGKDQDEPPVATGLPRTWDEIAPGHLVIAQETLEYGWWEAIVIARNGDMLTLRFRDYPKLPKFVRHRDGSRVDEPSGRITIVGGPADHRFSGPSSSSPQSKSTHRLALSTVGGSVAANGFALASPIRSETTMTTETKSTRTERIKNLNDELRRNLSEGAAVMTCGVAALGPESDRRLQNLFGREGPNPEIQTTRLSDVARSE